MFKNMGINEILKSLIIGTNVDIVELASATGISRATIYNILSGKVKRVRSRTAKRLADYFRITVAQLKGENTLKDLDLNLPVTTISSNIDLIAQVPLFIGEETALILEGMYPEEPHIKTRPINDPLRQEILRVKYYLWLLSLKAKAEKGINGA